VAPVELLTEAPPIDAGGRGKREAQVAAADGFTEGLIFVFWVDDDALDAHHKAAQGLELDGEGFTGTRLGEDDHVGVFEREAVEEDEAVVVAVEAVEDAFVARELGRGKWEAGGERAGVHVPRDLELVGGERRGGVEALLHLHGGGLGVYERLAEDALDLAGDLGEVLEGVGVHGEVETEAEEALLPYLQFVAQLFGVLDGGFEPGVADFALLLVDGVGRLELAHLAAEVVEDYARLDRVDEE
jgi:hypothetical protein